MRKIPFIEQTNYQDCGIACIAMLLAEKGKYISIDDIRATFKVGSNGLNMKNLSDVLIFYGANIICGKSKNIETFLTPSVIHLKKGHYVVLEKLHNGIAHIIDPAQGKKKYSVSEIQKLCSEYFLHITDVDKLNKKKVKIPTFKPFLKVGFCLLLVSIVIQIMLIQVPLIIKKLTDAIDSVNLMNSIPLLIVIIIAFTFFIWVRGILVIYLENKLDYYIMNKFILKLISIPISEFSLRSKGDLVFRATANDTIKQILSSKVISLFIDSIFLIFYTYLLFKLSSFFAFIIFVLSFFVLFILILTIPKVAELTDIDVTAKSDMQSFYTELIGKITDVKTQNLEELYLKQWEFLFSKQLVSFRNREALNNKLNTLLQGFQFSLPLVIFILGIYQVHNASLTLGTLLAINAIGSMFITPVVSLSNSFTEIIYVKSYITKITDIINYHTPKNKPRAYEKRDFSKSLKIENLSFSYGTFEKKVLKNINMVIPPRKKIAIVGKSGSGKSTLLKIIAGIYTDYEGTITINNKNLVTHSYQNHVGVVLQESSLFNKTIKDNISQSLSEKECLELLQEMNFTEDIANLPYGLQTKVNDEAQNFSGGQIQKILLARSLSRNPSLLLYDEATSALDNENQRIINKKIRDKQITQIIIAHRLSTVLDADLIYVLEDGEIIEKGCPKYLLSIDSKFSKMLNGREIE